MRQENEQQSRLGAWLASRCMLLSGLLGFLFVLVMPPFSYLFLSVIIFGFLLLIVRSLSDGRLAFYSGWWFGFCYFLLGLHWIGYAFLVDAERFAWMIPFVLVGLSAFYALFYAVAFFGVCVLRRRYDLVGLRLVLVFSILWSVAEMARGYWFSGFPWNVSGIALSDFVFWAQSASFWGVWGLGFAVVFVSCCWATLFDSGRWRFSHFVVTVSCAVLFVFGLFLWGQAHLTSELHPPADVRLHLVQGHVPQKQKWVANLREQHFNRHRLMSIDSTSLPSFVGDAQVIEQGGTGRRIVIWPETAVTKYALNEESIYLDLASILNKGDILIVGALRQRFLLEEQQRKTWNSLFVIDHKGNVIGSYDKTHLVPFGEYIPSWRYFPLERVLQGFDSLSAGSGLKTLALPSFPPLSATICYEAIFPSQVVLSSHGGLAPSWIINLTNDAWFGDSFGPWQHLAAARLRTIEEGIPLVRVANTGVSAVIDAHGFVRAFLPLGSKGIIRTVLPPALKEKTFYSRYGNRGLLLIFALLFVSALTPWTLSDETVLQDSLES